ncbi:Integrase core domain [Popillia japonica]|uniref:Integrase core domain n=1 Tax=Popillia japonica TaxID=7064 RepID=A0AAW1JCF4_POPJA
MKRLVKKYVRSSINYMFHKSASGKKLGILNPIHKNPRSFHTLHIDPIHKNPRSFHTLHIDHLGPLVSSKLGNTQVLVCVDAFTKLCFIYPVLNTKTKYVILKLNELFKIFGAPKRIISDRGRSFTSKSFKDFCSELKITHHLNAVGMPCGNDQVERYNRTILDALSTMGANRDEDEWDENVHNIQLGLNDTVTKSIGVTASEVMFRFKTGPVNCLNDSLEITDMPELRQSCSS